LVFDGLQVSSFICEERDGQEEKTADPLNDLLAAAKPETLIGATP
jgi:hypothetical protein